ncbi:hypothetical protein B0H16DRAFT_1824599 [Mycena metata]|uniref:Uncharacterized protein n=1 Tax=Mycena metata TaxID=1033252 RepID=A0AAD7GX70_9AGAR|nr:hypothetical protein B0H16DRAFT_1824599 [Mycena metata]
MSSVLPSSDASGAAAALPVVDDEGFVVCPECGERRHKPGISQDGKLSGWFTQRAPLVPSTVVAPAPIPPVNTSPPLPPPSINPASVPSASSNVPQSLLDQLREAIRNLPATVPEASDSDVLATFGGDPAQVVDAKVPAIEIYEHLNPLFHAALGWSMSVEDTAQVLRRATTTRRKLNAIVMVVRPYGIILLVSGWSMPSTTGLASRALLLRVVLGRSGAYGGIENSRGLETLLLPAL